MGLQPEAPGFIPVGVSSCREDVIDQEHDFAHDAGGVCDGEGILDVAAALVSAQFNLWPRPTHTHERALYNGYVELSCEPSGQHRGLVEFALHEAVSMQGHGDDGVEGAVRKMLAEMRAGELQKWALHVQLAAVFEEVDGLPQRPFVTTESAGMVEEGWSVAARPTSMFRAGRERHGRPEGTSTTWAIRRLDETDEAPTGVAETSRRILCDGLPATIAVAGKNHIDQTAAEPLDRVPHPTPLASLAIREAAPSPRRPRAMSRLPPRSPRARR